MELKTPDQRFNALEKINTGGGLDLSQIQIKYSDRPSVAKGFSTAYEALQPVVLSFQDSLFRNGEVVVVSGLLVSSNPNTILYDKDGFRFISPVSLTDAPVDSNAYSSFLSAGNRATTDAFGMDAVPTARLMDELENDDDEINSLIEDLESVVSEAGLSVDANTVGDYVLARVEKFLSKNYSFIPNELVRDVADRFMTGKGKIALRLKKIVTPEEYKKFRELDSKKNIVVQEAIIPLEGVIQRLGIMIIDKLDLVLTASNQDELLEFVKDARRALEGGFDFKLGIEDGKTMEGIRVALARLEQNEALFKRATEGIVFTFKGQTYKLTGLFTPINKLRGFFAYGKAKLPPMRHVGLTAQAGGGNELKTISEGGNAFKDAQGNIITRQDRIPRSEVEPIVLNFVRDILEPLGMDHVGVGTTVTDSPDVGDVDVVVSAIDAKSLYSQLLSHPELQKELPEIPGVESTLYASWGFRCSSAI